MMQSSSPLPESGGLEEVARGNVFNGPRQEPRSGMSCRRGLGGEWVDVVSCENMEARLT